MDDLEAEYAYNFMRFQADRIKRHEYINNLSDGELESVLRWDRANGGEFKNASSCREYFNRIMIDAALGFTEE